MSDCIQPCLVLRRGPVLQRLCGGLRSQQTGRPLFQHLQMMSAALVDPFEIPCSGDDLLIALSRAWPRFQKNQRFHIDFFPRENLPFLLQWIWRDLNAVLQVPESFITQISPESPALGIFAYRHVKKNHSPSSVPRSCPALLGIASSQSMQAPLLR